MNDLKPKPDILKKQAQDPRLRRPMTKIAALIQDMEDVFEDEDLKPKKKLARLKRIRTKIHAIATLYLPE